MADKSTYITSPYRFSLKRNKKQFNDSSTQLRTSSQKCPLPNYELQENQATTFLLPNQNKHKPIFNYHERSRKQEELKQEPSSSNLALRQIQRIIEAEFQEDSYTSESKYSGHKYLKPATNKKASKKEKEYGSQKKRQQIKQKFVINPFPQNYIPSVISRMYEEAQKGIKDRKIHFQVGFLDYSGYIYYAIEKKVVLIEGHSNYSYYELEGSPIIIDVDKEVLYIKEIIIEDKEELIEIKKFGFQELALVLVHNWSLSFYSFDYIGHKKLIDFRIKHDLTCQIAEFIDYDKKGNLHYLDEQGKLFKLQFLQRRKFYPRHSKYSLRNYLCQDKPSSCRKKDYSKNQNFFHNISQTFKDLSYYLSSKSYRNRILLCDRDNHLIYTLTKISTSKQGKVQTNQELRIYSTKYEEKKSLLTQVGLTPNLPQLIQSHSQDKLYNQFLTKLNPLSVQQFQIYTLKIITRKQHMAANLLMILTNGSRLYIKVEENNFLLLEIRGFPNLQELQISTILEVSENIAERCQIVNEVMSDNSWIVDIQCYRKIMSLLFIKLNQNFEEVNILEWPEVSSTEGQIFVNPNQHRYYKVPSLHFPTSKYYLSKCAPNVNSSPVQNQVLGEHTNYTYIMKNKLFILTEFRPIDLLYEFLTEKLKVRAFSDHDFQQEINKFKKCYNLLSRQDNVQKEAYNKIEIMCMLTQIYCDIEGTYFERIQKDLSLSKDRTNSVLLRNKFKDIQNSTVMKKIAKTFQSLMLTYSLEIDVQGPTLYFARLLSSLWNTRLFKLNCNQLQYVNDVIKRLVELVDEMEQFKDLRKLGKKIMQLNRLLLNIESVPNITYGQAVNADYEYFQEYIFNSIQNPKVQVDLKPNKINSWKYLFESYVSKRLFKTVKLYEQIQQIKDKNQILEVVLKNQQTLPSYFIEYLVEEKNLRELEILLNKSREKKIPTEIYASITNPIQKIYKILKDIANDANDLQKKYLLLNYGLQIWKRIDKNCKNVGLEKELEECKRTLKIQKMIKEWYRKERRHGEGEYARLINYEKLSKQKLLLLLEGINSPKLNLLYYSYFDTLNRPQIKRNLKVLCLMVNKAQDLKRQLHEIFLEQESIKLPSDIILEELDTHVLKQIQKEDIEISQMILRGQISNKFQAKLWVADFILKEGWSKVEVYEYYTKVCKQKFEQDMRLIEPNDFLYYWLNGFLEVRDYYRGGGRIFRNWTQNILQRIENRSVNEIVENLKLLLKIVSF